MFGSIDNHKPNYVRMYKMNTWYDTQFKMNTLETIKLLDDHWIVNRLTNLTSLLNCCSGWAKCTFFSVRHETNNIWSYSTQFNRKLRICLLIKQSQVVKLIQSIYSIDPVHFEQNSTNINPNPLQRHP